MLLLVLVIAGSATAAFYFVFMGGRTISMPAVEGMMSTPAVESVQKLGLLVRIDQVTSQLPSGTVVSQWPASGEKVARGRLVALKVSRGGERKALPDVRGLEFGEARAKLAEAGFQIGDVLRVADPRKPGGTVIAQSPSAPAMVPLDNRIDLLLSRGTGAEGGPVDVPDILGQQETAARTLLASAGLGVQIRYIYSEATAPGIVTSISPKAGAKVPAGSRITLTVATTSKEQAGSPEAGNEEDTEAPPRKTSAEKTPEPVEKTVIVQKKSEAPPVPSIPEPPTPKPETKVVPASTAQTQVPAVAKTTAQAHTAKVRYQVPPLSKPMSLRIEVVDPEGTRTVLEKEVKGGEAIAVNVPYVGEAAVTVYLGGEFVWQDRYRP
jgi:serine/threonine-protein kinase